MSPVEAGDGVSFKPGDRVKLIEQTNVESEGIWIVTDVAVVPPAPEEDEVEPGGASRRR